MDDAMSVMPTELRTIYSQLSLLVGDLRFIRPGCLGVSTFSSMFTLNIGGTSHHHPCSLGADMVSVALAAAVVFMLLGLWIVHQIRLCYRFSTVRSRSRLLRSPTVSPLSKQDSADLQATRSVDRLIGAEDRITPVVRDQVCVSLRLAPLTG
jgi:hypothetical protein